MPEFSDPDNEQLRVMLRDTTDHLRLPARLADTARIGAVRRTRRHRALWAGLGVATVTMAVTGVAMLPGADGGPTTAGGANTAPASGGTLPESCPLHVLSTPADGQVSLVTGGDPSGRYLLTRSARGAQKQVSIWTGDSARAVPMTGEDPVLADANTAGIAVGSSFVEEKQISWLYRDGALQRLLGDNVSATAINRGNVVVGSHVPSDGRELPVVWRALDRPAEQLPLPDGASDGKAVDVADDGTIIGVVYPTVGDLGRGYVWLPNGEHHQLPLPTVDGRQAVSYWPTSIHGTVVDGIAGVDDGPRRRAMLPVTFDLTTGAYTAFPKHIALPVGNGRGILAGQADGSAMMSDGRRHLRLDQLAPTTTSGEALPSASTAPSPALSRVPMVVFISDDARTLAGQAVDVNGLTRAVVWRCR